MTNPHPPLVCGGVALDELGLTGAPYTLCAVAPDPKKPDLSLLGS